MSKKLSNLWKGGPAPSSQEDLTSSQQQLSPQQQQWAFGGAPGVHYSQVRPDSAASLEDVERARQIDLMINREQARERKSKLRLILYAVLIVTGLVLAVSIFVVVSRVTQSDSLSRVPQPAVGKSGAVAAEHPLCSEIGVQLLRDGGNAVDSAIGTALCIGTVNLFSSGIGGGGFMLVRLKTGEANFVDFRETAPAAATEDMFNNASSVTTGLSVAIPGEIHGFVTAHTAWGSLPWSKLFEPSIKLAEEGFAVSKVMAARIASLTPYITPNSSFAEIFTAPDGRIFGEGDTVKRTNYAATLRTLANDPNDFYKGDIMKQLVAEIVKNNGTATAKDFANYKSTVGAPESTFYRGLKVYTGTAPSSGPILLSILNIIERYQFALDGPTSVNIHRLVEAFKHGYAERTELGDPAFLPKENADRVAEIISKNYAAALRHNISDAHTFPWEYYNPKFEPVETPGTTHISVVDKDDNAVAMTSTINLSFGSKIMNRATGIVLNNEMDDFSQPNKSNAFGLRPSKDNFIRAGKRPLSSCVPTIIERDGQFALAVGGSGGSYIITATAQAIVNMVDFNMNVQAAITAPRLHHQLLPNVVAVEGGYSQSVVQSLRDRQHNVTEIPAGSHLGDVQAVMRLDSGEVNAGADPRKGCSAVAY